MATGFPFSKTIITIRSRQTNQKTGKVSQETRYYLSSQYDFERSSEEWINLSRQHWAGVESRNHWRRDATMGEDRTRLSFCFIFLHENKLKLFRPLYKFFCEKSGLNNPNALANLALIRNLNLHVLARQSWDGWLPSLIERLAANPGETLTMLKAC